MRAGACLLYLCLATVLLQTVASAGSDSIDTGDFWGSEDTVEAVEPALQTQPPTAESIQPPPTDGQSELDDQSDAGLSQLLEEKSQGTRKRSKALFGSALGEKNTLWIEAVFALVAIWFVVGVFTGKEQNNKILKAWTSAFLNEGGIIEKNFAQLGANDGKSHDLFIKESPKHFKFWASGRRHCQGMKAELIMQPRQDLLMRLIRLVTPTDDLLDIEVPMNEASMPLVCLAVATPKLAREMQRELEDVQNLAHRVDVSRQPRGNHSWASDKFVVLAEHSGLVADLIPDAAVEHIFSKPAFQAVGRHFRYLHITSDMPGQGNKRLIRFCCQLPANGDMAACSTLLSFVMFLIDAVGNYKPNADQKRRAEKARSEVERKAWRKDAEDRNTKIQERKEKRQQEEMDKAKKAGPEAYAKFMEKRQKLQQKRSMGKMMKVMK